MNKKINILLLFGMLLLLLACTKETIIEPDNKQVPINFGATIPDIEWVNNTTRATNELGHTTFSVFGYTTTTQWNTTAINTPNLFNRQKVEYSGSQWSYIPQKYWQNTGGYAHFFAFAPWGAAQTISTLNGMPQIIYDVPVGAQNHIDLLWALDKSNTMKSDLLNHQVSDYFNQAVDKPINIDFHHALTRISFSAKLGDGVTGNYTITSITMQNLYYEGKGEFKISKINGIDAVSGATWKKPSIDKQRDFQVATDGKGLNATTLSSEYQPITATKSNGGYDGYMYMMPQPIEVSSESVKPTIIIAVKKQGEEELVVKIPLSSPDGKGWHSNQAINYQITYNGGGAPSIALKATVTDWKDQTVNGDIYGTYLNLSQQTVTATSASEVTIYYATDGSPVKGTYNGITTELTNTSGKFTFTVEDGVKIATITAGKLSRTIAIN